MIFLPIFPLVYKQVTSISPWVKHVLCWVYKFGVRGTNTGSTVKGAGTDHRAFLALSCMSRVPTIVHLIEVNFTFGTVLFSLFINLRIFNVLPHVMWLNNSVWNSVHRLWIWLGEMSIHLGEQKAQSLEGLFLGAWKPLNSIPISDEGALIYSIAFWLLIWNVNPRHSFNERWHIKVFFFVGYAERHTLGFGFFSSTIFICVILLGDLCAAGGVTPPLGFPVSQKVKNFIAKARDVLL